LRDSPDDFEAVLRALIPTLEDALRLEPLGSNPWRFDIVLIPGDQEWEVVSLLERDKNRLVVLGAYPKMPEITVVS
jgi:hypothetical protein